MQPAPTALPRVNAAPCAYLADDFVTPDEGSGTWFPSAPPSRLLVRARAGSLIVWCHHTPDGANDPQAVRGGLSVLRGQEATVTNFRYGPLAASAIVPPATRETPA